MENYYLDWSELTKRVYITNGKKKKDVTEWYDKIVAEREQKNISSKPMLADSYPLIEKQLLKTIQGNGLAISRFMEWLKAGNFR